jgi:hypothetical protein
MEQLTPNLVLPDARRTWSNIVFAPTASPRYGYAGTLDPDLLGGYVFKFGPLLRSAPPCDPTGITLTGKMSRTNIRVVRPKTQKNLGAARGPVVRYTVTLANANKKDKTTAAVAFAPAGLVVTLPSGTTYVKASVSPRPTVPGAKKHDKTLATAVYDAAAHTVTWPDAPLAGGKKRKYTVVARVNAATAVSPLVFHAACPNCPQLEAQNDVTVGGGRGDIDVSGEGERQMGWSNENTHMYYTIPIRWWSSPSKLSIASAGPSLALFRALLFYMCVQFNLLWEKGRSHRRLLCFVRTAICVGWSCL